MNKAFLTYKRFINTDFPHLLEIRESVNGPVLGSWKVKDKQEARRISRENNATPQDF